MTLTTLNERFNKTTLAITSLILVGMLAVAGFGQRQLHIWFATREYEDAKKCRRDVGSIQFKRLSEEKSFPFLDSGRPLSEFPKTSYYDTFRAAVARFPDVKACLVESEQTKRAPDLSLFDWRKIRSTQEAEVCLFRVFSSIGNTDGSVIWLQGQGFGSVTEQKFSDSGLNRVEAYWNANQCAERFVSGNWNDWPFQFLYEDFNIYAGFEFAVNGEITNTYLYVITE